MAYHWPKPHSEEEYPKISYVAYFEPWNWVLGTGVYLDDMRENVAKKITQASGFLMGIYVLFVLFSVLLVSYLVRRLEAVAVRDPLTNLYTKRFFNEVLPSILSKHQRDPSRLLAVIFIDIDHFKGVNDDFGHKAGDQVLLQVAKVMMKNVRQDDFCIRFGGEEFVIVGNFDSEASVVSFTERIRQALSLLTFTAKKDMFGITVSAGIAVHRPTEESFDETLDRADAKLYQSKKSGRNCVSL